jgi:uncharacterized membrane protein
VLFGSKGQFVICIEKLLGLLLFLLSLKVLAWVVCLSHYNLVFFSHYSEFFLESELHVFFQVFVFAFCENIKNQSFTSIEVLRKTYGTCSLIYDCLHWHLKGN